MTGATRRDLLRYAAGGALAFPLGPASRPVGAEANPSRVWFAWWTDVGRPTPFQVSTTGPGGAVLLTLLYDPLTWKDATGVIPWLASAWSVDEDGLAYRMRLVEGAN